MPEPAAQRTIASWRFLACALLLGVTAAGMGPAVDGLTARFSKAPIPLRRSLHEFDHDALPSFAPDPDTPSYSPSFEVGTEEWVDMTFRVRGAERATPAIPLLVTYYSDPRDQVPHTPEVCYVQAGGTIAERGTARVPTPFLGPERPFVEARLLRIQTAAVDEMLVYFFWCNGRPTIDREKVRWWIGFPGPRHIYFAKLEAVSPLGGGGGREAAIDRCVRLLSETLQRLVDHHFPRGSDLSG
jgi:hypothetical protein